MKKNDVACPFCYASFSIKQSAFRCSGQKPAGSVQECGKGPDGRLIHHFGPTAGEPVLPVLTTPEGAPSLGETTMVCAHCKAKTSLRACPECHQLLPDGMNADSQLYAMVGVRNSGKTILLAALDHELRTAVGRRFDAAIDTPNSASGLAGQLRRAYDEMTGATGSVPQQTADGGAAKQVPAVYTWRQSGKRGQKSRIFSFFDNAGEALTRQDRALDQQYLNVAAGVILILDPFAFPENRKQVPESQAGAYKSATDGPEEALKTLEFVLRQGHHVAQNTRIPVPVAVVVSKIDHFFDQIPPNHPLRRPSSTEPFFDNEESISVHDHVKSLIASWGGDGLLRTLDQGFSQYRLFGASALGNPPDYATGRVDDQGVMPHRVSEPLLWLLAADGFIPSDRAN